MPINSHWKQRSERKNSKISYPKEKHRKAGPSWKSGDDNDDMAECLYCGDIFGRRGKGWIRCCVCQNWVPKEQAGVDNNDGETSICDLCS